MSGYNNEYYRTKQTKKTGLEFNLQSMNLPELDLDDIEQVSDRASLYFTMCVQEKQRAGIVGLCLWLGITTEEWESWCNGEKTRQHQMFACRIRTLLESEIENRMLDNKIPPLTGMFLLKSQYGYDDSPKKKKEVNKTAVHELPLAEILRLAEGNKKKKSG